MGRFAIRGSLLLLGVMFLWTSPASGQKKPKAFRIPPVDLKQQIIWGATCDGPDGTGLAFGGQDQKSDDGIGHTRIKVNGEWKDIHEELRKKNPLQKNAEQIQILAGEVRAFNAWARHHHLEGHSSETKKKWLQGQWGPRYRKLVNEIRTGSQANLEEKAKTLKVEDKARAEIARGLLEKSLGKLQATDRLLNGSGGFLSLSLRDAARSIEQAAATLDAEPPPRALSPIVYDAKTKLYVLFGGDHLDYLTNDVWVFDPAQKKWTERRPKGAPEPCAGHVLKADGDGKVRLSGGYSYTSSTDYCGSQYRSLEYGEWIYDLATDGWKELSNPYPPDSRVYRQAPFYPEHFLANPKPDAAAFQKQLTDLPANTWVSTKPPHLPQLNRDWGTAVLDPDRDLILRFSGGHSAHGGTDVLHYHLASNRWELPFPVEFPLGQLYSNTSYPEGFNFNRRPWVTGHTYQNYGYDPVFKKMLFTGQTENCFIYDPAVADWTGRFAKPKGMVYGSCFYTLTLCPTPQGLVCWTQQGQVFQFDASKKAWVAIPLKGDKLPGSVVDNSTVVHDSKRDRLLFFRKGYGDKAGYDGRIYALDRKTGAVSTLSPKGMEAATAVSYLCQIRYDPTNDLLLVGGTMPGEDGSRRTPAYDCTNNAWITLKLGGDDPSGKTGRNVSLGMMYDAKRKRFWAVDTRSNVFVLRLDPKTADPRPLK